MIVLLNLKKLTSNFVSKFKVSSHPLLNTKSKGIPQKLEVHGFQCFPHIIITDKLRRGEVRVFLSDAA